MTTWANFLEAWRNFQYLKLIFFLPLLSSCAVVDTVGSRAGTFNQQAADAKSESILTNIIRAAYAEPLQFTELSSATGQGSISGSIGAGVPFPFRGGKGVPLPQQIISGTLGSSTSFNNSFAMVNQSNQEFYQGIKRPISQQLIFSFMAEGFDPRILLNIFVSDIEISHGGNLFTIRNDPEDPKVWNEFYAAVNELATGGLDAEKISDTTPVGPVLSGKAAQDPKLLAALIAAPSGAPALEEEGGSYRLVKREASYRPCFRGAQDKVVFSYLAQGKPNPAKTIILNKGDRCGASPKDREIPNTGPKVRFRPRSVEGAILYLGALVRTQWGLGGSANSLEIPRIADPSYAIFKIHRGVSDRGWADVRYRGATYGISLDPSGNFDGSSRVMQLLTGVLALQSSSKDTPAPSVVTLIGP